MDTVCLFYRKGLQSAETPFKTTTCAKEGKRLRNIRDELEYARDELAEQNLELSATHRQLQIVLNFLCPDVDYLAEPSVFKTKLV